MEQRGEFSLTVQTNKYKDIYKYKDEWIVPCV